MRRLLALVLLEVLASSLLAAAGTTSRIDGEGADRLREGHWIEVRGRMESSGIFVAEKVEVLPPGPYETLIGTATGSGRPDQFLVLGQPVSFSEKTTWGRISPEQVAGRRVKVEGRWRGPLKFSSRKISPRGEGRDRLVGRVDQVRRTPGGVEVRLMRFTVFVPEGLELVHAGSLAEIPLAKVRIVRPETDLKADEDDLFGDGIRLAENLVLSGQFESKSSFEDNYDLDPTKNRDRRTASGSARLRFDWRPSRRWLARVEGRYRYQWRDEQAKGPLQDGVFRFGETFFYLEDALGDGWDLQVGRQDFDDPREWIYDQNLDAVRVIAHRPAWRLELSASTTLSDGSARDEDSFNLIGHLSNNDDRRLLAAWIMYRDMDLAVDEESLWVGARAMGSFVPQNELWLDLAALTGERGSVEVGGVGFDAGTTWSPPWAGPLSFTAGYAFGSGDRNPDQGNDRTFRQTGLDDNNGKFAGVTSYRYYGELTRPELSNIGIATFGIGVELAERTTLDLIYHSYRQDEARDEFIGSDIKARPTGFLRNLGWEVDAILGARRWKHFDLEVVGAVFEPGSAFVEDQYAYFASLQLRYRL